MCVPREKHSNMLNTNLGNMHSLCVPLKKTKKNLNKIIFNILKYLKIALLKYWIKILYSCFYYTYNITNLFYNKNDL